MKDELAAMPRCDLIAIGGSAGGLTALMDLLQAFRPSVPASLFVVLHRASSASHIDDLLQRCTPLKVVEARDGQHIEPNHIYIAAADRHLLIAGNHIHLRRGPRENNFRPAIDPTFRSLAVGASNRGIGILLSGFLDDGAAGLRAIAQCGGTTMVQDPSDAQAPDMPRSAISALGEPDLIASAAEIGRMLGDYVTRRPGIAREPSEQVLLELCVAGLERATIATEDKLGDLTPYNCPDCNGVLWEITDGPLRRYRCHTGHSWTEKALLMRKDEALEQHLYETLRALNERVHMLETLAERYPKEQDQWVARAQAYRDDAASIEEILVRNPEPVAAE